MKRLIFLFLIIALFFSCDSNQGIKNSTSNQQNRPTPSLDYTILKDDIYDIPIKTQVELHILIKDTGITEQKIRDLLTSLYNRTKNRTGFKYHTNPTNIFIYAFTTIENANSGTQWIGMISKSYSDTQPSIFINDNQINSLNVKPTD